MENKNILFLSIPVIPDVGSLDYDGCSSVMRFRMSTASCTAGTFATSIDRLPLLSRNWQRRGLS